MKRYNTVQSEGIVLKKMKKKSKTEAAATWNSPIWVLVFAKHLIVHMHEVRNKSWFHSRDILPQGILTRRLISALLRNKCWNWAINKVIGPTSASPPLTRHHFCCKKGCESHSALSFMCSKVCKLLLVCFSFDAFCFVSVHTPPLSHSYIMCTPLT